MCVLCRAAVELEVRMAGGTTVWKRTSVSRINALPLGIMGDTRVVISTRGMRAAPSASPTQRKGFGCLCYVQVINTHFMF